MPNILVDADKRAGLEKLWWEWHSRRLPKEQWQAGVDTPLLLSKERAIKPGNIVQIPKIEFLHLPQEFLDFLAMQRFLYELS